MVCAEMFALMVVNVGKSVEASKIHACFVRLTLFFFREKMLEIKHGLR